MIYPLTSDLLRRHVANRPHHRTRIGVDHARRHIRLCFTSVGALDQLGESEVKNFDLIVVSDEDVVRLEVTMDDPFGVRCGEAVGDLEGVVDG